MALTPSIPSHRLCTLTGTMAPTMTLQAWPLSEHAHAHTTALRAPLRALPRAAGARTHVLIISYHHQIT